MGFRKPISTLGGLTFWDNIRQNKYFIMQEHKVGFPVWPYKYRILMRENRMEIANSNDYSEIKHDWNYLEDNAVPQLNEKIDWLGDIDFVDIVTKIISKKI
ncbi:hypothetical protein [Fuchsiella alkaliacetigena]|uniref:hypothetical protein n=1 Tax=Fuchsiella alkaliacetigena TaxID=957042 RepID=UPI00200AF24E|nr:hypothetical protein [Fuchsiella alkaliacetigena]MCK8825791.1 hypothetical protein [Fuchsiella alkaliacetigena]